MAQEDVINWEVDVGSIPSGSDSVKSPVITIGGLKWSLGAAFENTARSGNVNTLLCLLSCENSNAREYWRCDQKSSVIMINRRDESKNIIVEYCKYYTSDCLIWGGFFKCRNYIMDNAQGFISGGKILLQARIQIIKTCGVRENRMHNFSQPDELSDVALVFGEDKVHVSKTMLSLHSPVFKAMLLGKFEEATKTEVEIHEVDNDEFVAFLGVLYNSAFAINEQNVESILNIADRFQVQYVIDIAEAFLMHSSAIITIKKLVLSDIYKLHLLEAFSMKSLTKLSDIKELEFNPLYLDCSNDLKAKIGQRTIELVPNASN